MNRVRMRASRALVALLIITLGIVFLATRKRAPQPPHHSAAQAAGLTSNVAVASNPAPVPILASNTTAAPTTQPIAPTTQPAIAIAPSTRPTTQPATDI